MSIKSLFDSIDPLITIRAKSKLDSLREQILWKNYCKSVANCQQISESNENNYEITEQNKTSLNDNKTDESKQQFSEKFETSVVNASHQNNCMKTLDQLSDNSYDQKIDDLISDEFKTKINYLEIQLKTSLNFESILRKKLLNVNQNKRKTSNKTKSDIKPKLKSIKSKSEIKIVAKTEVFQTETEFNEELVINKFINELIIDLFDTEFDKLLLELYF